MTRRLAAILAADVVGFSRLMGADEAGTHARLRALTEAFIEPLVADHSGRIVKLLGDGYLVEFGSAVDAVECAVAWQRGPDAAATVEKAPFSFRIGINVGDVIVDGDDLYGDGVNVAARLEALAKTGAILVSSDTYRQVRGKTSATFDDLGEVELKNIEDPVHVYQITESRSGFQPTVDGGDLAIPEKPSIAILPFANSSEDADQEYFSDGITEDIITALSRVRWFFVIARNSSFSYKGRRVDLNTVARELGVRYVLEGSVRRAGDRVRVSARLAEGSTGNQLWAKRYDRVLSDLFTVQDEITETIVAAIEPELGRIERERARARTPGNLDAWEAYQQGMWHLYQYTPDGMREARAMFHRAIERDPVLGPAFSGIAESFYFDAVYGYADTEACRRDSLEPARRAVEIDRGDAGAWCTLGRIHYLRREHSEAVLELETALELNPSLALAHYGLGAAMTFSGRADEAIPHLENAIRLSPYDPNMGSFLVRLADANYFLGRYEDAAAWARRALAQPGFQWSRYGALLAALGRLGRQSDAEAARREVAARRPEFSVSFVRDHHLIGDNADLDGYLDGLRAAGVAEG